MLTILTGIVASVVAEIITWLNKKLSGTVLHGDAAFFLAAVVALIAAAVKIYLWPVASFQTFLVQASMIWATSQIFFIAVVQLFHLDVQPTAPSTLG